MPKSHIAGIEIIKGKNGTSRETKLVLFINGRWVKAPQPQIALLACLYREIGYLVPYETLCSVIGHREATKKQKHILRQYMGPLKQGLSR